MPDPNPSAAKRLIAGAIALALAAIGVVLAVRAFRLDAPPATTDPPSEAAEPTQYPPLTGVPRITAEIPLPEDSLAGGVAVGAGSAWIGVGPVDGPYDPSVLRIDLASNEILAEIPVRITPWRDHVAATDDGVWVAADSLLERIDPEKNRVVDSVELPGYWISSITADRDAVWVVAIADTPGESDQRSGTLLRIDPSTNAVVSEIPLGPQVAGYDDEVRLVAGSVWILGVRWSESEQAEYGSDLIRVDPATNSITARIPIDGFHMATGSEEVWVRSVADGVSDRSGEPIHWTRVDARSNEASAPLAFDGLLEYVSPEALWGVGYAEHEYVRVTRYDPETLEIEARSEPVRSHYHDAKIDPSSGTVWISAMESIVRMDID